MIPLTLQLKNFLSYGNELQTIDFSTYNLICFSGKNGHGKSALLDAITWAIWGSARKTFGAAKADQGLLRLGQTQMMVCLDFQCNDAQYRVRRELTIRHKKPVAALDFGIIQPDGSLISLTDKTIRATQEKIESSIHLDFESFCNSAFLRQGQSNEFCKKSPKDRKDILSRVLGLQKYETIRRLAMDKAKNALMEKQQLALLQENIETEVATEAQLATQNTELQTKLIAAEKETKAVQDQITKNKTAQEQLTTQKNAYVVDLFALEQNKKQTELLHTKLRTVRQQWRTAHAQQRCFADSTAQKKELEHLTQACATYQIKLQKGLVLKEQFLQKKQELQTIEAAWRTQCAQELQEEKNKAQQLLLEQKQQETNSNHLQSKLKELSLHNKASLDEQKAIAQQITETQKLKLSITASQQQLEKRKEAFQGYKAEGTLRSTQLKELKQKQLLACKTQTASCPLCEQTVTASRRRFLTDKFMREERKIEHKIRRLARIVSALKPIIIEQHNQLEPLLKKIHELPSLERHQAELTLKNEVTHKEIQAITAQQEAVQKQISSMSNALHKQQAQISKRKAQAAVGPRDDAQYKEISAAIAQCEQEAKALQYNAQEHKAKEAAKHKLEQQLARFSQLQEQLPLQEERKKQIHDICNQLRSLKTQHVALSIKTKEAHTLESGINRLQKEQELYITKLKELQQNKEQLLQQKGSLETQFKKLELYKEKQKTVRSAIAEKVKLHDEFSSIAQAMGKDGIQALLIEEVIPEIEYEANELLARLTQNQAQIIIESVRDLKSGGTRETLDIFISDALGLRAYELFSGGEAFRIDFALRIAISKLVARRAGTSLQTLIIDEGFGSQDEEGLSLMMEALYTIQDDFEKIIIVSHLPFMKDHFPVHFTIEKGSMGSTVSVLQQG